MGPTQPHSDQVHAEKYRAPGESHREAMNRVASAICDNPGHYKLFRDILMDMRFMPAGRVQAAVGSAKHITPYNCFVAGTMHDSFVHGGDEGQAAIMKIAEQAAATMRMGGGIGYDFSTLRPSGALIKGVQASTDGPLAFMPIFDAVCKATSSAGNRRGAQMGVLRVDHPDIAGFIRAKQPSDQLRHLWAMVEDLPADHPGRFHLVQALQETLRLTGFNLSIGVTDEFMDCLATGRAFPLRFGQTVYNEIDPAELWETVMRSTWDWAEPGVLFIDTINRMNNLWYCETIAATNPCVPAGTPILTKQGWQSIDALVGESVDVWNGEEWSTVEPHPTGVDQELVTVRLSNGESLTCTPSHRFALANGQIAEARELLEGEELLELDWPVVEGGIDAPEAYTQGAFAGDGWETKDRGRRYLSFKREDKKAIEPWLMFANAYDTKTGYRFYHLKGIDLKPKSWVPDVSWSVKSRLDWLAGLLDTDGTANWSNSNASGENKTCSIYINSVDKVFVDQIALLLRTLGAPTNRDIDIRETNSFGGPAQHCHRIAIRSNYVRQLVALGLQTHRLDLRENNPLCMKKTKVKVVDVVHAGKAEVVFCFREYKKSRGCFNGVLSLNCGEQPLPPHGACLLGSFNLAKYIVAGGQDDRRNSFDWGQLALDIRPVVRAMDNVVDYASYPLPDQEREAKAKRRMGLGVTGLANAAEALGHPYGSQRFLDFEARVLEMIRDHSYEASVQLAREKGPFPLFSADEYCDGEFVKTVDPEVRKDIRLHGIRNSHLTSIAPTGTMSYTADNVSSGIEPVFMYEGQRRMKTLQGDVVIDVQDYGVREFGVYGKTSDVVSAQEHVDVLVTAAARVDSAVSKTCNVSPEMPWDEFKGLYVQAHQRGAKGCTTFNPGGKRLGIFTAKVKAAVTEGESCEIDFSTGRRSCE